MSALPRFGLALVLVGASFAASAENLTPNLKFNGFATATGAVLDDDQGGEYIKDTFGYPGLSEEPSFGLESLIGLQFDYRVNDKVNVVAQLVAEGRDYYKAEAEWAYIVYQLDDNWRVRGGRFALPTFMYSDSIHVGQSYPWVRLPLEAYYGVPVTNFDGVDLLYRKPLGEWNLNAQLLLGGSNTSLFRTQNSNGINVSLGNDNLTLRAGIIKSELTYPIACAPLTPCPLDVKDESMLFSNVGALYDDGQWFVAGELAQLKLKGWLNDWNAGYLSAGHYFGKWLPYVLASKINSFNGDDCTAIPFGLCTLNTQYDEQTTYAVGVRYALFPNVSVKGQLDHVTDFNGSNGLLTAPSHAPDAFNIVSLSLTTAF